jgi:hypothetical protein
MFDAQVWGTVGQWVGAIGTTSAFIATFYVIRRDANIRRKSQARKVALYAQSGSIDGNTTITVSNLSDEPIYDIWLPYADVIDAEIVDEVIDRVIPEPEKIAEPPVAALESRPSDVLLPGASTSEIIPRRSDEIEGLVVVTFRDNSGSRWQKSLDGRLRSTRYRIPIRWRLILLPVYIVIVIIREIRRRNAQPQSAD